MKKKMMMMEKQKRKCRNWEDNSLMKRRIWK
jgi:hypothetical protein